MPVAEYVAAKGLTHWLAPKRLAMGDKIKVSQTQLDQVLFFYGKILYIIQYLYSTPK